jgi:hypothetical protein
LANKRCDHCAEIHGLKVNTPDATASIGGLSEKRIASEKIVIEDASEKIAEGNFILVHYPSFWWSEKSHRSLLEFFFNNRDFRLIFPGGRPFQRRCLRK